MTIVKICNRILTVLTHREVHAVEHRPDDGRFTRALSVVRQELKVEYPETEKINGQILTYTLHNEEVGPFIDLLFGIQKFSL